MSRDPSTDDHEHTTSRRRVLGAIGAGAVAGTGLTAGGTPSPDDRPGRYMVGLKAGASFDVARARADTTYHELDFGDIGKLFTGRFPEPALDALRNNPQVRYVEPDVRVRPDVDRTAPVDSDVSLQSQTVPYGISLTNADDAIADGHTGAGIDVAILDSGIDPDHEDLAANLGSGTSIVDCSTSCGCHDCGGLFVCPSFSDCETHYDDREGHGTHVAGTAAAADNATGVVGVAPDATIHAYRIGDCTGCAFTSDICAGFNQAADDGRDVLNLSYPTADTSGMRDAVDYADNQGVVMVTSAGNGDCSDCIRAPGIYPEVITVTAVDENEDPYVNNSKGSEVDLTAPGVSVESTVPNDGYGLKTGTSMASPHVVGAAALLLDGGATPNSVRKHLTATAEDIGLTTDEGGAGLLDVGAALRTPGVVTEDPTNVGSFSADLNGRLDHLGDADSVDVYFEWRHESESTFNTTATQTLTSPGSFSEGLSDLQCGGFLYRAVAEASDGDRRVGNENGFLTRLCDDPCDDTTACTVSPVEYRFGGGGS